MGIQYHNLRFPCYLIPACTCAFFSLSPYRSMYRLIYSSRPSSTAHCIADQAQVVGRVCCQRVRHYMWKFSPLHKSSEAMMKQHIENIFHPGVNYRHVGLFIIRCNVFCLYITMKFIYLMYSSYLQPIHTAVFSLAFFLIKKHTSCVLYLLFV